MKFVKDILIFDCVIAHETDIDKSPIIQLAGILLDKNNLLQRAVFDTYIKTSVLDSTLTKHSYALGIPEAELRKSPRSPEALKKFVDILGVDCTLTCQTANNYISFRNAFRNSSIAFPYTNPLLELWGLEYMYTLTFGLKKLPTLETVAEHFRYKINNRYNAIDRVKAEAHVLRQIVSHI